MTPELQALADWTVGKRTLTVEDALRLEADGLIRVQFTVARVDITNQGREQLRATHPLLDTLAELRTVNGSSVDWSAPVHQPALTRERRRAIRRGGARPQRHPDTWTQVDQWWNAHLAR